MATLMTAVNGVMNRMKSISGMNTPSDNMPPEGINVFPFAVCFPDSGQTDFEASFAKDIHVLKLLVLETRSSLPNDVSATVNLYETIRNKFVEDPTLGNGVTTIVAGRPPLRYTYGQIQYGSGTYLGYEFEITCKILG